MFEQERMIGRLQRRVADESEIVTCFLSGSFGRHAEDSFSDLDVALVFKNENVKADAWAKRNQFAQSIMPYLSVKSFDAEHIRPYFHIVLYANGSKLDFRYESQESLTPNPWDRQIRILKDAQGWAEAFQAESSRLSYPRPTISSSELINLDRRFWIMFWDILRQLGRGDSEKPFTIYLDVLNFTLPPLIAVLPQNDSARQGLINVSYGLTASKSAKSMIALLEAYLKARSAIISHHSLQVPIDIGFESEIKKLLAKLS